MFNSIHLHHVADTLLVPVYFQEEFSYSLSTAWCFVLFQLASSRPARATPIFGVEFVWLRAISLKKRSTSPSDTVTEVLKCALPFFRIVNSDVITLKANL